MASPGQTAFIEDLMERHDLLVEDLPDEYQPAEGYGLLTLPAPVASELIDWLKQRERDE